MRKPSIGFLFLLFAIPLLSYGSARTPEPTPKKKASQTAPEKSSTTNIAEEKINTPATTTPASWDKISVFLSLRLDGEPQSLLNYLKSHPEVHVTLIFPPHYFDESTRKPLISQFSMLQSSQQIEVGLALDNEPMLPLLADLREAGEKATKWGVHFAWPEDIAAQIARGSSKYQKRWGNLPSGFYPPYATLSEVVVQTLKKFRLNWVMGRPGEEWGVDFFGGTALLIPPKPPVIDELTLGSKSWAEQMSTWSLKYPYVFIDTSHLEDPKSELIYLESLVKKLSKEMPARTMVTGKVLIESLRNEFPLSKNSNHFENDYDAWVTTPQQKRAWAALVDARQVIETYQSSGRANLQRLDAAIEEMCSAESGAFLLELGSNSGSGGPLSERPAGERNFLATLANIYRLCDTPVPADLNTWFAARTWQKTAPKSTQEIGPFFVEGPQSLTWNDPKDDDNGAGAYKYPVGSYPKGMFDLKEVTISWNDSDITLTAGVAEPFAGKPTNVVPLVDIYIDVNRLTDAGSTTALKRRGNTQIAREAAWEYAVALSPNTGVLYQAIPGGTPRTLTLKTTVFRGKTFSVTFPRTMLHGDPRNWRLSVGLLGTENNRRPEEQTPVSILVNAMEKTFGGAPNSQVAPFLDLLDAASEDQVSRIDANMHGSALSLPYVESQ